jgi:hypothetical protein
MGYHRWLELILDIIFTPIFWVWDKIHNRHSLYQAEIIRLNEMLDKTLKELDNAIAERKTLEGRYGKRCGENISQEFDDI